jgi:hypothetical protein
LRWLSLIRPHQPSMKRIGHASFCVWAVVFHSLAKMESMVMIVPQNRAYANATRRRYLVETVQSLPLP